MQPLDGQTFQVFKHEFRCQNNEVMQWGASATDKVDFLTMLPKIREKAMATHTIRISFKKRGIWPYNPDIILPPLREKMLKMQDLHGLTSPPLDQFSDTHRVHHKKETPIASAQIRPA
jgi:hypothetical protein